jgi:phosphoglycolate phosphatase-like HAD superfamily hydrolase
MKKYLIFDLDGTLMKSVDNVLDVVLDELSKHS